MEHTVTRKEMRELMSTLKTQIVDTPMTVRELTNTIGELMSYVFRVDIFEGRSSQVDPGDMNINACYDPDKDMDNECCIEITLVYNPSDEILLFDEDGFNALTVRLCDALAHEQIHKYQYRCREWLDPRKDVNDDDDDVVVAQGYLSEKDEIDAYSHNIANELLDSFAYEDVYKALANPKKIKMNQSINLWAYMATFGMNFKHPVLKRLLKKVYQYLPNQHRLRQ